MAASLAVHAQALEKADAAQQKAMVEKISQTAASIRTMECQFSQVKTLGFLNDKLTSGGRMLFVAEGGKLRWEYQQPYSYTFILNGDKAYIRSAKSRQTIDIRQSRLFQSIAEVMMNSVTGKSLTTSRDFGCEMYSRGDEWQAVLTPKRKELKEAVQHHPSALQQRQADGDAGRDGRDFGRYDGDNAEERENQRAHR